MSARDDVRLTHQVRDAEKALAPYLAELDAAYAEGRLWEVVKDVRPVSERYPITPVELPPS